MPSCLVVDGSSVVRKVAKRILASDVDAVIEADSGKSAFDAVARKTPDVLFVDCDLGDMNFIDFIRDIRAMRHACPPRIIVMMNEMNLVQMTKAKRAGADDYLLKPFNREQLSRSLREFQSAA